MFSIIKSEKEMFVVIRYRAKVVRLKKNCLQGKDYTHEDVVCFKIYALTLDFFVTTKNC